MLCYSIEIYVSIFSTFGWTIKYTDIQLEISKLFSLALMIFINIIEPRLNNFRYPIFLVQYLLNINGFSIISFFVGYNNWLFYKINTINNSNNEQQMHLHFSRNATKYLLRLHLHPLIRLVQESSLYTVKYFDTILGRPIKASLHLEYSLYPNWRIWLKGWHKADVIYWNINNEKLNCSALLT